jgi:hypothetical protein
MIMTLSIETPLSHKSKIDSLASPNGLGHILRLNGDVSGPQASGVCADSRYYWNASAYQLLGPCAAALNQKNKHGNKQNAGNNPNDHHTVHLASSFLNDWPP